MKRLYNFFILMALCGAGVLALGFLDGVVCGHSAAMSAEGLGLCLVLMAWGAAGGAWPPPRRKAAGGRGQKGGDAL